MIRRRSLTGSILLIAALNVTVLGLAFTIFVLWQLRQEFESFLLAGAGERLLALSRQIGNELEATPGAEWDRVLARHQQGTGVALQLALNDGTHIAGARITIPEGVHTRLRPVLPGSPPVRGAGGFVPGFDPNPPAGGRGAAGGRGIPPVVQPLFLVRAASSPAYWVGVRMPIRGPDDDTVRPGTLLVSSATLFGNPFLFQPAPWLAMAAIALGLSALCWLPWIGGVTRAVRRMEAATDRIATGRFDVQIDVRRDDEVGRLAAGITDMASRLSQLMQSQQRFLSDAAHELRSPLTRIQLALDLIEQQPPEKRLHYVRDVREDVEEMRKICDALLELGASELRERQWNEAVDIHAIVDRAVRLEARGSDVRVDVPADLRARGNTEHLGRAVANVVRNAIFYAGADGPVEIEAREAAGVVEIAVRDHGPGVAEQELDRLFTPFYRLDAARDRRSGGTGLGLAIVRAAIEACGGQVECRNRRPHGLEVRMMLKPIAPA